MQAESGQKAWVCEEVRGGAKQVLGKPNETQRALRSALEEPRKGCWSALVKGR